MTDFFKCTNCGKVIKVIYEGKGILKCCEKEMPAIEGFGSVNEILDFAIEKEDEAKQFYQEWALKLSDENLRAVFDLFASEEQKHKDKLERVKSGSTFKPVAQAVTDLKIVDYLVDFISTPDMDYQEALILAMKREKNSFKLYNDLAAMTASEDLRTTFLALAQEEAKHKLRLETEYEKDIFTEN